MSEVLLALRDVETALSAIRGTGPDTPPIHVSGPTRDWLLRIVFLMVTAVQTTILALQQGVV